MAGTPILVVGGRTTGLMMASELARRGIPTRIVDKSPGIDPHVRANLLHSRTLEIFQGLGLAEQATEGSFAEHGIRLHANGRLVGVTRHEPVDSPFPFGMSQSQAHTEAVLERHLNRHGVEVERGVELTGLTQGDGRVVATLRHPDARHEVVETPWLIGCDGAHSTTRHLTGCAFPGGPDRYPYVLADVRVDADLNDDEAHAFLHDEGDLFVFTALPGRRRLVVANVAPGDEIAEPPTLGFMQSLVDTRGQEDILLSDPRWLARFHIHYRLTPHYRQGRVFLAGDAAHVHSLLAGQGMNTGIQDAFNLAWKLASVERGTAPVASLDTYEAERRPVGAEVVAATRKATEEFELYAGLSEAERERLIRHMAVPVPERTKAARHLQEIDIDYRASALSYEGPGGFDGGPHAGAQAPDAVAIRVDGTATSLYRLLGRVNHQLLLFTGSAQTTASATELEAAVRQAASCRDWIDTCVVSCSGEPPDTPRTHVTHIEDPSGTMHARYAADVPSLYLIRPDGYVAHRRRGLDGLGDYLGRVR